jgi:hypothetical protein
MSSVTSRNHCTTYSTVGTEAVRVIVENFTFTLYIRPDKAYMGNSGVLVPPDR